MNRNIQGRLVIRLSGAIAPGPKRGGYVSIMGPLESKYTKHYKLQLQIIYYRIGNDIIFYREVQGHRVLLMIYQTANVVSKYHGCR